MTSPVWAIGDELTAAKLNARPYVYAYQTSTQSLASGSTTWTAITMGAELVDTIGGHSTAVTTARYTPNVAGYYECLGQVAFNGSTAGDRAAQFRKNGAVVIGAPYCPTTAMASAANYTGNAIAVATIPLNGSTDYVELYGSQTSGGALSTFADVNFTYSFMICRWVAGL